MLDGYPQLRRKLVDFSGLAEWRQGLKARLVVVNGCFDLIHAGHLRLLESARRLGDALLVALNSDTSVRALKGSKRPINYQLNRAAVVSGFACVDAVTIFEDTTATEMLRRVRPDVWVKGGDYTLSNINQDERNAVEAVGGAILFQPIVEGLSSTALLEQL